MIRWVLAFLALSLAPAHGFELSVPGALVLRNTQALAAHDIATGPAKGLEDVPTTRHEGPVTRLVWRIDDLPSTLGLVSDLEAQLIDAGFRIGFGCDTRACGGFEFRFGIDVAPAPQMFLDLSDFHYLSAFRDDAALSLVVSRSGVRGYVQMTLVGGAAPDLPPPPVAPGVTTETAEPAVPLARTPPPTTLAQTLARFGRVVLEGVTFATGTTALAGEPPQALRELADYLAQNPSHKIALVGHTDTEGGLDSNLAVSERRAASVARVLIQDMGVNAAQISAHGIAYLAPRAGNLNAQDRATNRRVEAVLIATE